MAKAAFLPTIKLTGAAGYASADLSTLAAQAEAVNRALVSASDTASLANER